MEETRQGRGSKATFTSMPHAMGRGAREDIVREALARIDGAPTPAVGTMQAAMGNEAQIRLIHDVIREHLDALGVRDTREWAARVGESA
jgi:hypothetical protein